MEVLAAETGYKLGMPEIKKVHKNLNREFKKKAFRFISANRLNQIIEGKMQIGSHSDLL